jgi:hypothetical protein
MPVRPLVALTLLAAATGCSSDRIRSGETPEDYAVRLAADHDAALVVRQLRALEGESGAESALSEEGIISTGYSLLMSGDIEKAYVIQQASVELFPTSSRAWENLGEVAIYVGDSSVARRSLERSIELDSTSGAHWMLDGLAMGIREAAAETEIKSRFEPGESTELMGPYLGQEPPGLTPEVFAPGIVSTRGGHEFSCTFSPDGREFYFNRGYNIYVSYLRDDGWTAPQPADFNSRYLDHEPHITADGSRMLFGSGRPRDGIEGEESYGIWAMERAGEGWGQPRFLFSGMYATTSLNGNAFVTDIFGAAGGGIAVYRPLGEEYLPLERVVGGVNAFRSAHPLIAPDENYMVFDGYGPESVGEDDLYLSVPLADGTWSEPQHLAEISTFGSNMTASLSSDGRFLFYYANHDIYWVSAQILEPYLDRFPRQPGVRLR